MTVLAKILSRGTRVPLKIKCRDFCGKYWNNCGFVTKCWYFFPETPCGFSSILLLWVYIICFWYHFLIVYWVIGSNFELSMFVFVTNFKLVFWCVSLFICAVVKPANRIWNYTYGVQLPQILSTQGICFFCSQFKIGSALNT